MYQYQWKKLIRRIQVIYFILAMIVVSLSCLPRAETIQCQGVDRRCPSGYLCSGDQSTCIKGNCGNGVPEYDLGEVCDDGNVTDSDGCDSNCTLTACGNGIPTKGEQCDDGNSKDGDGCDNNCTSTMCGNGVVTFGEMCDDGIRNSNIGRCLVDCQMAECGDGFTWDGVEECDNGPLNADNGECLTDCQWAKCGDGYVRDGIEVCDDGNDDNCGTCSSGCDQLWGRAKGTIAINVDADNPMNPNERFALTDSAAQTFVFRYVIVSQPVQAEPVTICNFSSLPPEVTIELDDVNKYDAEYIAELTVAKIEDSPLGLSANRIELPGPIVEVTQDRLGIDGNKTLCKISAPHLVVSGMLGGTGSGALCSEGVRCKSNRDCASNNCRNGTCAGP